MFGQNRQGLCCRSCCRAPHFVLVPPHSPSGALFFFSSCGPIENCLPGCLCLRYSRLVLTARMTMATAIAAGVAVAAVVLGAAASLLCAPQLLFGSFALPVFFFFCNPL